MRTSFEEKTYENFFNSELDRLSNIYFPLGQVQEGFLGFDSSADSKSRRLWRRLGYPFLLVPPFPGIELREIAREMERHLEITIDELPQIKANLLFQYKKPDFMKSSQSKEWSHWNQPYFRYGIYEKQQSLLNKIDLAFGDKVLIIYASPAAKDINELVNLKTKRQIISSSNFTKASDLNGHSRNTYIESGTNSIACSKPQSIQSLDIITEIESLGNNTEYGKLSNRRIIKEFSKEITSIISQDLNFERAFQLLTDNTYNFGKSELLRSFFIMNVFRQITGLQWLLKI